MPERTEPVDVDYTETVTRAAVNPETKKLTLATVQTLQKLIGEQNCDKALAFCQARYKASKITSLFDLSQELAQRIIDVPENFIQAIGGSNV